MSNRRKQLDYWSYLRWGRGKGRRSTRSSCWPIWNVIIGRERFKEERGLERRNRWISSCGKEHWELETKPNECQNHRQKDFSNPILLIYISNLYLLIKITWDRALIPTGSETGNHQGINSRLEDGLIQAGIRSTRKGIVKGYCHMSCLRNIWLHWWERWGKFSFRKKIIIRMPILD